MDVHDPFADPAEAEHEYAETLMPSLDGATGYDCVVGAVPHAPYASLTKESFDVLLKAGGLIADIKGTWRHARELQDSFAFWSL